ncbi:alpha/beta fold hydrolase [Saccharopolyspora rhizosphaerae]|uniref:alpha/beta fold hydrolase n=1 Tax=Saccharopolyspora rhizosphaerae TaxID=2492662 RepID=UPI001F426964|nr:alpha/beta hydrolase [Saccharopolyspora rhizosphaerae]
MTAPPQGVEVDQIEFPAGKIRYYEAGTDGPPIVLLHGGGPDNALISWRNTIEVLAADHRVYAPDLPGQGGSTEWRGRANQRTFEEVLRWLLDAWRVPQATLVGLSMGGSIATGFTLRHPQRVRALALVDSTGVQHRMPHHLMTYLLMRAGFTGRAAATMLRANRSLVRLALNKVFFADASSVSDLESIIDEVRAEAGARRSVFADWHADAINRRSMTINHVPQLPRIACPVTVIHGEKDALVPVASAHEVARAIPGAQLRVMPQAGHWPNRERPTEFNALLREFVNAVNTPTVAPANGAGSASKPDATTEAPTRRIKTPAAADAAAADEASASEEADEVQSADGPTRKVKISSDTASPEKGDDAEPTTDENAAEQSASDDTAAAEEVSEEATAEEGATTEATTEEPTTAESSHEDSSGEEASDERTEEATDRSSDEADTAEADSDTSVGPSTSDDRGDDTDGGGEKKATVEAPTRFLKVGAASEGTKHASEAERPDSARPEGSDEPAKDDAAEDTSSTP